MLGEAALETVEPADIAREPGAGRQQQTVEYGIVDRL
jgi:hypothetical protein